MIVAVNAHPALPDVPILKGMMAFLSICASGVLLGLFFLLRKRSRIAWFIAVGFLAVTCLLTIFDDFGWSDLLVLGVNIIPLLLLIKNRAWYLQARPGVT